MSYTHVRSMVEFAIALMGKLELINTHSFNNFKLRIGEHALVWYLYQANAYIQYVYPLIHFYVMYRQWKKISPMGTK